MKPAWPGTTPGPSSCSGPRPGPAAGGGAVPALGRLRSTAAAAGREAAEYFLVMRALRPELGSSLAEALVQGGRPADGWPCRRGWSPSGPTGLTAHYHGELLVQVRRFGSAADAYRRVADLDPARRPAVRRAWATPWTG
ncbi:MAG: hypothetical protein U0797_09025 [Gemmataceae bacterium]